MNDSLNAFTAAVRCAWGPLDSDLVAACRDSLARLTCADETDGWLASLLAERPASRELYRDPDHGFVLQAHPVLQRAEIISQVQLSRGAHAG